MRVKHRRFRGPGGQTTREQRLVVSVQRTPERVLPEFAQHAVSPCPAVGLPEASISKVRCECAFKRYGITRWNERPS